MITCVLLCMITAPLLAEDWNPNDDTFDPNLQSVVIGDRSWIGDPSPFVHSESSRTGYTYVNATDYEGMDPALQVSLMVPLQPGETVPAAGGMLMMTPNQAKALVKAIEGKIAEGSTDKQQRVPIATSIQGPDWGLKSKSQAETKFIELENKTKDKVDTYRFSINASKLLGAIKHSLKKLEFPSEQ
ncbi:hypothetical protein Rcae01_02342 [Novipirellula caenicola]|uniref:Uncharacterized protein n=2 Tax=Novipirellula caenicola TaxID=1536901 RepID=A0ABP9VP06_9BACT